ncbi:MAG: hypothetical protein SF066_11635 [Thermoanaerobaculia bacterium]|nr:hypothetical protein [Thermoanaerobaculia bacterium]
MKTTDAVSFFLPGDAEFGRLGALDPDQSPLEFQTAERAWTLQTYLRLARAGEPVRLTNVVPSRGVVVFHAGHKHIVQRYRKDSQGAVLVALRGDRKPVLTADFEILQNGCDADGRRTFAVPHWPQPGLVPRDASRGLRVRRAAYKGYSANLDPAFLETPWQSRLAELGIEWHCDAAPFDREGFRYYPVDWSSYRDIDVIVAVRPSDRTLHATKPASKLVNAWLAGVPAVLGAESACRALRRDPLDYFEVGTPDEAEAALRLLRDEPRRMADMIENGRRRAAEFRLDPLLATWRNLLFETIPSLAVGRRPTRRRSLVELTVASWLRRLGAHGGT